MTRKALILILLLLFSTVPSFAKKEKIVKEHDVLVGEISTGNLSLEKAINIALKNQPLLKMEESEVERTTGQHKQTKSGLFPYINIGTLGSIGPAQAINGPNGIWSNPFKDNFGSSLNARWTLFDFGQKLSETRARKHLVESASRKLIASRAELILAVKKAYYQALFQQKALKVAESIYELSGLLVKRAETFYETGLKSKVDLQLAKVKLSEAKLNITRTKNALNNSFAELNNTLGIEGKATYELDETLAQKNDLRQLALLITESFQNRPEIKSQESQLESAKQNVIAAKRKHAPKIEAIGSAGYIRGRNDFIGDNMFAAGAILLDVPVFTGGQIEGQIKEAQAFYKKQQYELEHLKQTIRLEVIKAYNNVASLQEELETTKEQLEQAKLAEELAQERYKQQLGSIIEATEAQSELINSENQLLQTEYRYQEVLSELDFAVGKLL